MNNKTLAFFGTVLIALISVLLPYYLNLSKPDVRYTLSEEIPISFSGVTSGQSGNAQQLEVRNVGSAEAKEIVVKISGELTEYKVIKYVNSDNVESFTDQQLAEFVYPSLPPQTGFKIIFISSNVINSSDVSVSHSTGQGVDALSASNKVNNYLISGIYVLLISGYVIWLAILLRNVSFDTWKSETKRKKIEQVLKAQKPWYVSEAKWATDHFTLIRELLREEYVSQGTVIHCAAYGFLSQGKPDHLSDSDWKELNDLAVNRLQDHTSRSIDSYLESSILSVIQLIKPDRFPKDSWNTVQLSANEKYIERIKGKLYGKSDMVKFLYSEKPESLPERTWETLQIFCRERYFNELVNDINFRGEINNIIKNNDINVLGENLKNKLEEKIQQTSKFKDYEAMIQNLLHGHDIPDKKPDTLTDWEWKKIKDFEELIVETENLEKEKEKLRKKEAEIADKQYEVESEQKNYLELRNKVLKQLDYINNIINEPSVIERVESYDDTFSVGNWKILRQTANYINGQRAG